MKADFIILHRKKGKTEKYFARFTDLETGRDFERSVDHLNFLIGKRENKSDILKVNSKTRTKAILITKEALDKGLVFGEKKEEPTFIEFGSNLWDFEKSSYIANRLKENPNSITRKHAKECYSLFNNYALPFIPEKTLISQFKVTMYEAMKKAMYEKGLTPKTVSKLKGCLSVILKETYRLGYIQEDISKRLGTITVKNKRERGIPTAEEALALLAYLDKNTPQNDYRRNMYLIHALAIYGGMRQGEIRALHASDIAILDEMNAEIDLQHGYNDIDKLKCTKGRRSRNVWIPTPLAREVLEYSKLNPDGFIFFSLRKPSVPIVANSIIGCFRDTMEALGVSRKEQEERNIDFHSLRHLTASMLKGNTADENIQKYLGHASMSTTEGYIHTMPEYLKQVGEEMSRIIPYTFGSNRKEAI